MKAPIPTAVDSPLFKSDKHFQKASIAISKQKLITVKITRTEYHLFAIKVYRRNCTHQIVRTDLEIYALQKILHENTDTKEVYVHPHEFMEEHFINIYKLKHSRWNHYWQLFLFPRSWDEIHDATDYQDMESQNVKKAANNSKWWIGSWIY